MAQKVLVVDDDPIMHRVLKQYMERNNYEMLSASTDREALEIASSRAPELILLDVRMPEMSGLAVLRRLKESETTKNIPVVVVTVNADRTTHIESQVSGAAAFLAKPFRPAELLELMRRLMPQQLNASDPTAAAG